MVIAEAFLSCACCSRTHKRRTLEQPAVHQHGGVANCSQRSTRANPAVSRTTRTPIVAPTGGVNHKDRFNETRTGFNPRAIAVSMHGSARVACMRSCELAALPFAPNRSFFEEVRIRDARARAEIGESLEAHPLPILAGRPTRRSLQQMAEQSDRRVLSHACPALP